MPIFPDAALFALCAACFLLRAVPRLRLPDVYVSDTYYHLLCARLIRENRFRLPERLPLVPLGHQHTYPFPYHYLLALLPFRPRLWLEPSPGALADTASLGVIYAFLAWPAGRGELPASPGTALMASGPSACSP